MMDLHFSGGFLMKFMRGFVLFLTVLATLGAVSSAQTTLRVQNGSQTNDISLEALKSLPHKTATIHNPHTNVDETYSGVPLIELLKQVGAPVGHDVHGKALAEYILATGSDGYKAVLALAEAEPDFHPGDVLVADSMDGKPLDAKSGPFKLVVTEDKRPARSVHNLVSIELKAAE
jgi:hypothetical protein